MILAYSNNKLLKERKIASSNLLTEKLFNYLSLELNYLDADIIVKDNVLKFTRKSISTTHTGKNIQGVFKILSSGEIQLTKTTQDLLMVQYKVNISRHLFISPGLAAVFSVLLNLYFNLNLFQGLITFLISAIVIFSAWFIIEKTSIDRIINSAVKNAIAEL